MNDDILNLTWKTVEIAPDYARSEIETLSMSSNVEERLKSLISIRKQEFFDSSTFQIASRLIDDPDDNCRWQSIIIIGQYIDIMPTEVWRIITQYGNSSDDDMRTAIATVLLEHFLERHENHIDVYLDELKARSQAGETNLIRTLSVSWPDVSDKSKNKIDEIVQRSHRG